MNERNMKNTCIRERFHKARSSERGETMPATIIAAIVSSVVILGVAAVMSFVLQIRADAGEDLEVSVAASNVDVTLRSDIINASYITANVKLQQPSARLLDADDIFISGVNLHIPESNGGCKVIEWHFIEAKSIRDLTIYQDSSDTDEIVKCDLTSPVLSERDKVFTKNFTVNSTFNLRNQVGREILFNLTDASLEKVNPVLEAKLNEKGVERLSSEDFNELNKELKADSFISVFSNPEACVMNAEKVQSRNEAGELVVDEAGNPVLTCPAPESVNVGSAWNSFNISNIRADLVFIDNNGDGEQGETVRRAVEQNSAYTPYAKSAEARADIR